MVQQASSGRFINSVFSSFVATPARFRTTCFAQILFGYLYSWGYFELPIAAVILGFIIPSIWLVAIYQCILRFHSDAIPAPRMLKNKVVNTLFLMIDIMVLLLLTWIILSGIYHPVWFKALFSIIIPLLTFSIFRNLMVMSQNQYQAKNNSDSY